MATYVPNTPKAFVPHPAGRHLAVCSDVFVLEENNYYYGKRQQDNSIDERETVHKVYLVFLTEVLTAKGEPSYISQGFSASFGDNSKLGKFLRTWCPDLITTNLYKYDLENLIGRRAEITSIIKPHKTDKNHLGYTEIIAALEPRKTDVCPAIPDSYKKTDVAARQQKADEKIAEARVLRASNPFIAPAPKVQVEAESGDQAPEADDDLPFGPN